jgi:hypothetical protein
MSEIDRGGEFLSPPDGQFEVPKFSTDAVGSGVIVQVILVALSAPLRFTTCVESSSKSID